MAVAAVDMVSERTMSPPCRVPVTGGNTVRTAEGGYGVYGGGRRPTSQSRSVKARCYDARVTLKTWREINHQFTLLYSGEKKRAKKTCENQSVNI